MKTIILSLLLVVGANAFADSVIKVSIFGKNMSPSATDFKNVNAKLGHLVSDFKIKKFEILAYGIEGGFSACVEPNLSVLPSYIASELRLIKTDSSQTMYDVVEAASCQ